MPYILPILNEKLYGDVWCAKGIDKDGNNTAIYTWRKEEEMK